MNRAFKIGLLSFIYSLGLPGALAVDGCAPPPRRRSEFIEIAQAPAGQGGGAISNETNAPAATAPAPSSAGERAENSSVTPTNAPTSPTLADSATSASPATAGTKFVPKATLKWRTESEEENHGFYVERSDSPSGPFVVINKKIIAGHGTTETPHEYSYIDTDVVAGKTYYYRLFSVSYQGEKKQIGPDSIKFAVKTEDDTRAKQEPAK